MKFIACDEIGESFCEFNVSGETDTEVKDEMFDHLETEHLPKLMTDKQFRDLDKKMNRVLMYQN